jgi:hypothetical protein
MYVCIYIHTYIHAYIHTYIHAYITRMDQMQAMAEHDVHVCMYIYIYTYTYIYIHTYIHTYIHAYIARMDQMQAMAEHDAENNNTSLRLDVDDQELLNIFKQAGEDSIMHKYFKNKPKSGKKQERTNGTQVAEHEGDAEASAEADFDVYSEEGLIVSGESIDSQEAKKRWRSNFKMTGSGTEYGAGSMQSRAIRGLRMARPGEF